MADAMEFARQVNAAGGSYHRMDLGGGAVVDGQCDPRSYLHHYGFPEDMSGMSVLDVGTSSGFFAFEFERRGAQVTAIDLWDSWFFGTCRDLLRSRARYVQKSVFDLDESFGTFDLVFCGSLLLHVRDIFGAMERLRAVCRGIAVVATAINTDRRLRDLAVCEFAGHRASDGEYWVYWLPTMQGLRRMLLSAGFSRAEAVSTFTLRNLQRPEMATPHGVVRAYV